MSLSGRIFEQLDNHHCLSDNLSEVYGCFRYSFVFDHDHELANSSESSERSNFLLFELLSHTDLRFSQRDL